MERKITIKIILIIVLLSVIILFDYYIYMFVQGQESKISNSTDFSEKQVFDFSRDYVENFFNYLENGDYDKAYDMLHENCKKDLFNSNLEKFESLIKSKYFDDELNDKTFDIKDGIKGNVNNEKIFHAYYEVNVICNNSKLKDSSEYYKDKQIYADVVKINGDLKIVLNLEQFKI